MTTSATPNLDLPNDIPTLHRMVQQLLSNVNEQARQIVDLQNQLDGSSVIPSAVGRRSWTLIS